MVTIDYDLFLKMEPKSSSAVVFQPGSVVTIVEFRPDAEIKWGKDDTVPGFLVEVNGEEKEVPAPAILNSIMGKPNVVKNEGHETLECVDFVGNSLHAYLKSQTKKGEEIQFPGSITIAKRINKGIPKTQINGKKEVYEKSYLIEDGGSFDEAFKDVEYIPTMFNSAVGTIRPNPTYLLAPID